MIPKLLRAWPTVLLATVALRYGWIGLATDGRDQILGVGGAVAILTAIAVARRSAIAAAGLLLAGTLPLPVSTWWSVTTPVLALLALLLARPALRAVRGHPG